MSGDKKEKQKFKVTFDALSCWGGAIVIIGSLFKILHLKGASVMISAGLGTEALLFFLSGFRPPHKDPEWTRVYPQLADDYSSEHFVQPASGAVTHNNVLHSTDKNFSAQTTSSTLTNLDVAMQSIDVTPDMIKRMGEGLKNFGEKISNISSVADVAVSTNDFNNNIKVASDTFKTLNENFKEASDKLNEVATSSLDSLAYKEQVQNLTKNLTALNAIYELELQESNTNLQSMSNFYENMSVSMKNLGESLEDSKIFKEEVSKLTRNLSSLNAVYGNMLSAVNTPRA